MKQLNGTITLSFLEEDNQQRVIFRVVPLCTREGVGFTASSFPDQGSLRVVPDKREQSTFKERMHSMGKLCAIQLISDGKELTKVRQNRNYDPAQGEINQYAIYSDVVCEFTPDGALEVFEDGADATAALTAQVLLLRDKVLYGPLEPNAFSAADPSALKPFGNDRFLLQTVTTPDGSKHVVYWDPEASISWRQRRGSLRKSKQKDAESAESAQPKPETTEQKPAVKPAPKQPKPAGGEAAQSPKAREQKQTQRDAAKPAKPVKEAPVKPERADKAAPVVKASPAPIEKPIAEVEARDAALPIGTKLEILDSEISFDEQISMLAQPLSETANRLARSIEPEPEEQESIRFVGTPIVRGGVTAARDFGKAEPLHQVVEQQLRSTRDDIIENPIESLQLLLSRIWQSTDLRDRALEVLTGDEAFMQSFLNRQQTQGRIPRAVYAAQAQLAEIEAERLSLLMQLDQARTDRRRSEEETLAAVSQKRRAEVDELETELKRLNSEKDALSEAVAELGGQARQETLRTSVESGRLTLSPAIGRKQTAEAMIEAVRLAENARGFACSEDEATELTLLFALCDRIAVRAGTIADAERFAMTMLVALGLGDVSARADDSLTLASMLPANGLRTPTVQLSANESSLLTTYGHKTILLLADGASVELPIMTAPPLTGLPRQAESGAAPVSLDSFLALRDDPHPMQGERWFADLDAALAEAGVALSESAKQDMRLFVAIASQKLRGGFLAAADAAVMDWIAPRLGTSVDATKLAKAVEGLPRAMQLIEQSC